VSTLPERVGDPSVGSGHRGGGSHVAAHEQPRACRFERLNFVLVIIDMKVTPGIA
jgi:hypothetical protein